MKKDANYILSIRARQDIKKIAEYTIDKFGIDQSKRYAAGLKKIINDLSLNPDLGKQYIPTNKRLLLRYRYKAHMIFYYPNHQEIFIVRVLSGKMNFSNHIK